MDRQSFHSCTFECGKEWVAGLRVERTILQQPGTAGWKTGAEHTQVTPAGNTQTQFLLEKLPWKHQNMVHMKR